MKYVDDVMAKFVVKNTDEVLGSIVKKVSSLETFKYASKYGIDSYTALRKVVVKEVL